MGLCLDAWDILGKPRMGAYGAWSRGYTGIPSGLAKSTEHPSKVLLSHTCGAHSLSYRAFGVEELAHRSARLRTPGDLAKGSMR